MTGVAVCSNILYVFIFRNQLVVSMVGEIIKPQHVLFVDDGMTGQDAVNAVKGFMQYIKFDGVILTKMDGDARGGAALSIREVTGSPILFVGTGERIEAFERFHRAFLFGAC